MDDLVRVAIFDDVVAARRETFHIRGLEVDVYGHADDAVAVCSGDPSYQVVFMDFAMGNGRKRGDVAVRELRDAGYTGRIIAISSDPAANAQMRLAGADEALDKKAHLRSFLVHLAGHPEGSAALK